MKEGLLIVERIVIESLAKKSKSLKELSEDTELSTNLLLNLLPNLLMKNLVTFEKGLYFLNSNNLEKIKKINLEKLALKNETKEIFTSLVNQYFDKDLKEATLFKMQKIFVTGDEEKILKNHLLSLENFINQLKQKRLKNPIVERTSEQKILYWGMSSYSNIIDEAMAVT